MQKVSLEKIILSGLLAFAGYLAVQYVRQGFFAETAAAAVFIGLGVFLALWGLILWALCVSDRRVWAFSAPLGFFFSLCIMFGEEMSLNDRVDLSAAGTAGKLANALLLTGAVASAIALIAIGLPRFFTAKRERRLPSWAIFIISLIVILLCWLPCYYAFFPGIYAYDIPTQINGISEGTLTVDHPLLHTLIVWGCMLWGEQMDSYTLGFAIYTGIQAAVLGIAFAASLAYAWRRGASLWWFLLSLVWFAAVPFHSIFAVNATKDVLFGACLVLYLLCAAALVRSPQKCLRNPFFWIGYVAAALAMAMMRNTGIYVYLLFIPLLIAVIGRRRILAALLVAVSVFTFYQTQYGLNSYYEVKEGRFTESMSVPLQQMAACAYDGVLNEFELRAVETIIPEEIWSQYSSRLADSVKNYVDRELLAERLPEFWKLWGLIGERYPETYCRAFLGLNVAYWYPFGEYPDSRTWHDYIECTSKDMSEEIKIEEFDLWPEAREYYYGIGQEASFEKVPVISYIFKPAVYFWTTLVLLAAALYHRRRTAATVLGFLVISWVFQFFSPIALLRYVYPFIAALPLAAGLLAQKEE